MLCLFINIIICGLIAWGFSNLSANPWLWFLWIPLAIVVQIVLFVLWVYLVVVPFINIVGLKNKWCQRYIVHLLRMISLLCGAWVKVEGTENLSTAKNVLYVSNHKSQIDPIFIFLATKRPCVLAGKSTLWKVKVLMPLIKAFKVLKIDRSNDREAAKAIIQGIKYLNDDYSVVIFPEGGIKTREVEQMVSLKAGAYKLATKSNAVIQPLAILGNSKLAKRKPWQIIKVTVRILPAIYPSEYQDLNTHEIGYKVINSVNANFVNEERYEIHEEE